MKHIILEYLMKQVRFDSRTDVYYVENFKAYNYESTVFAMSQFSENLSEKLKLGKHAYRRMCVLPNASFNTYVNSQ